MSRVCPIPNLPLPLSTFYKFVLVAATEFYYLTQVLLYQLYFWLIRVYRLDSHYLIHQILNIMREPVCGYWDTSSASDPSSSSDYSSSLDSATDQLWGDLT